jgi:Mrp family chromosome partitioning ATPase/capsular polysaccharide biosynthesis protein
MNEFTEKQSGQIGNEIRHGRKHDELGDFFARFFRIVSVHRWMFLFVMVCVTSIVVWYSLQKPEVYQASFEVFYNESMHEVVDENKVSAIRVDFDKNYWLRAMVSDELMRMVVMNSGLPYTLMEMKKSISATLLDKRREDRVPVFWISIRTENREDIPILIKSYINALNALLVQYQVANTERLVKYYDDQIKLNTGKLNELEVQILTVGGVSEGVELLEYEKIKANLDEFRKSLLQSKVNLSSVRAARVKTELELKNLDGTVVNESAFSEPLKVQLMNLEVDLARALTKHKEEHPTVKQIKKNIIQINAMLRDSIEQRLEIRSMMANPLKSQLMSRLLELQISEVSESTRIESLEKVIRELEVRALPNAVNQDQQQLLRNREMIFLTIKQLNEKLIETQSASQGSLSRFVYIDDASNIFLSNKGILYYLLFALLIGIFVASLVVFIYDLLDDRIMLVDDFEHFYSIPLLGIVRHYRNKEVDWVFRSSLSEYANIQEMGGLVVNLRQFIRQHNAKTLVVASSHRQEGKSHASLKIAVALAMKRKRVLLVDLDFFAPRLSRFIIQTEHPGLTNYIVGDVEVSQLPFYTEVEGLDFIGAGDAEGRKELFYTEPAILRFIKWARENYDVVVFDTPASSYIPDIIELFDQMDAILLVVRLRVTTRKSFSRLLKSIGNYKTIPLASLVNDVYSKAAGGESYEYEYEYEYQYPDITGDEKIKVINRKKSFVSIVLNVLLMIVAFFTGVVIYLYFGLPDLYAGLYYWITDILKL